MGQTIAAPRSEVDVHVVQERLHRCLTALEGMIGDGLFDTSADTSGFEVELDLVDPLGRPRLVNQTVLDAMDRHDVQAELQRFNLEINLPARPTRGVMLSALEAELHGTLTAISSVAADSGGRTITIGTLPTLHASDLSPEHLSANPRYPFLDAQMRSGRRHEIAIDIEGRDHLRLTTDSIAIQGAATSLQAHVRVAPESFCRYFNAAQAVAPLQVAISGNSPFLLGHALWQETRIALLEQSLDLRNGEPGDEPPRAWAGDRWSATAVDVLADNVQRYPPLIPVLDAEDPLAALAAGRIPALRELRLHNGTIWRWNRPVYDVQHGHPHLRIENRVLPSGPTAVDMVANAALFLGLVRGLADLEPPVSSWLPFSVVVDDLHEAARHGLGALLRTPLPRHAGQRSAAAVVDAMLPIAARGLDAWGVDPGDRDHYLRVIERRTASGRTGARWQTATVDALEKHGATREAALREMVRRYVEQSLTGTPVHEWPV